MRLALIFFKDASLEPTPTPKVTPMPSKADRIVVQRMSDVQESPVEWLWPEESLSEC